MLFFEPLPEQDYPATAIIFVGSLLTLAAWPATPRCCGDSTVVSRAVVEGVGPERKPTLHPRATCSDVCCDAQVFGVLQLIVAVDFRNAREHATGSARCNTDQAS